MALGKDRKFGMYFYQLHSHGYKKRLDAWKIQSDLKYRKNKLTRITKESDGWAIWVRANVG